MFNPHETAYDRTPYCVTQASIVGMYDKPKKRKSMYILFFSAFFIKRLRSSEAEMAF